MVISFPVRERPAVQHAAGPRAEAGQVVILPVIRIERFDAQPARDDDGARRAPARKRRRRATRS